MPSDSAGPRGPLASSYPAAVALVLFALTPFLVLTFAIFASGGARLQRPEIEPWLAGERGALRSPPLGAALGRRARG